jgi:hypothetical protein
MVRHRSGDECHGGISGGKEDVPYLWLCTRISLLGGRCDGLARDGDWRGGVSRRGDGRDAPGAGGVPRDGAEALRPCLLSLPAEACGNGGQIAEGLCALEEALMAAEHYAERFCEADLHRVRGELSLQQPGGAGFNPAPAQWSTGMLGGGEVTGQSPRRLEVEACFRRALDIGRRETSFRVTAVGYSAPASPSHAPLSPVCRGEWPHSARPRGATPQRGRPDKPRV